MVPPKRERDSWTVVKPILEKKLKQFQKNGIDMVDKKFKKFKTGFLFCGNGRYEQERRIKEAREISVKIYYIDFDLFVLCVTVLSATKRLYWLDISIGLTDMNNWWTEMHPLPPNFRKLSELCEGHLRRSMLLIRQRLLPN
jgi:hypothetical protein